MLNKDLNISPQVISCIKRVLLRGETAQVKYNERDNAIKVYGVRTKLEKDEEGEKKTTNIK